MLTLKFSSEFSSLLSWTALGLLLMKRMKKGFVSRYQQTQTAPKHRSFKINVTLLKAWQNLKHLLITTCLWKHKTDRLCS